jgi:hypothetical protein
MFVMVTSCVFFAVRTECLNIKTNVNVSGLAGWNIDAAGHVLPGWAIRRCGGYSPGGIRDGDQGTAYVTYTGEYYCYFY